MNQENYFFNEESANFALTKQLSETDLNFFKSIGINHNSRVLEQCCGRGVVSNTLAKVFQSKNLGLDIVSSYIDYAKKRASQNSLISKFEVADITKNKCFGRFDYVINWNTSWAYYDNDQDNLIFLENAFKNLRSGGKFVLEYYNSSQVRSKFEQTRNYSETIEGIDYHIHKESEITGNNLISEWTIKKNDKVAFKQTFFTKLYTLDDIVNMLATSGFKDVVVKDRFSLSTDIQNANKFIFVGTKP